MMQNIKVDVIYYMGAKDFEMEFNLGGCCHMRLLTAQVKDSKSLVHSLSRAVSRSRVIICVGPLFSETGLIHSVANAVRIPTEAVNKEKYGINSNSEVNVIKGSLPLVTADGIFGGCIVESGPQSIILLSESKSVRKALLSSLIHPYIKELSMEEPSVENQPEKEAEQTAKDDISGELIAEDTAVSAEDTVVEGGIAEEEAVEAVEDISSSTLVLQEEISVEQNNSLAQEVIDEAQSDEIDKADTTDDITEDTEENAEENAEQELSEETAKDNSENSGEMKIEMDEGGSKIDLYIEPQRVKFSKKNYYDTHYDYGEQSELYYADNDEESVPHRPSLRVPVMIFTVILLLAVLVLVYFMIFVPLREGYSISQYTETLFTPAFNFFHIIGG
ncbi:MAG: hypothetical protein E7562_03965 [Ruminococcaceae bacterium]|nr:hypothetical protein [Oscillospiraceae bacterium]